RLVIEAFNRVDSLHLQLDIVRGRWTPKEIYTFIKGLFRPAATFAKNLDNVSVVLSDAYMFEETDLGEYLEHIVSKTREGPRFKPRTPTLFIPKSEAASPLHWSCLVHEMGHTITKPIDQLLTDLGFATDQNDQRSVQILRRWTDEILCDL